MSTAVFLIIFGTIYGLSLFAFLECVRKPTPVDDDGYPIKAKIIPFLGCNRRREVA